MVGANGAAARLLSRQESPALYRVHEPPDVDRSEQLRIFLACFGIHLTFGEEPQPSDFQRAIDAVSRLKNTSLDPPSAA